MSRSFGSSHVARGLRVSFGILFVLLLLAEVGVRLAGPTGEPPPLSFRFANRVDGKISDSAGFLRLHDSRFWELRPGGDYEAERVNSLGLRGPELVPEDDVVRLAVLGDSCTFGIGVPFEKTYGAQLEELLGAVRPDVPLQVLNAGVPGYSLVQGARTFEELVLPLEPAGVVLYFGAWNDFNPAMGSGLSDLQLGGEQAAPAGVGHAVYDFMRHSRLFELCALRYAGTLRYRHWRTTVDAWLSGEPPNGYRVPLADFTPLFARLLDRCQELDLPTLVVLPELNDTRRAEQPIHWPRLDAYRAVMRTEAEQRGITVVDLRQLFSNAPHTELFVDMVHPSGEGHRRLAKALAKALAEAIEREVWLD